MDKLLPVVILLTGLAACGKGKPPETSSPPAPMVNETGERTFKQVCFACHGTGAAGAPKVGSADQWGPRIQQGSDTLYQHALNGFTGSHGTMPPRGGRPNLSDLEVKSAVDYMVSQVPRG